MDLLRAIVAGGALVILTGCATGQVVIGPDGQAALQVRCQRNTSYGCERRAERICSPGGYQVLDNGVRIGTFVTPNGYAVPNQAVFQGFMVVRCR